jgi:hypothetical protein
MPDYVSLPEMFCLPFEVVFVEEYFMIGKRDIFQWLQTAAWSLDLTITVANRCTLL